MKQKFKYFDDQIIKHQINEILLTFHVSLEDSSFISLSSSLYIAIPRRYFSHYIKFYYCRRFYAREAHPPQNNRCFNVLMSHYSLFEGFLAYNLAKYFKTFNEIKKSMNFHTLVFQSNLPIAQLHQPRSLLPFQDL